MNVLSPFDETVRDLSLAQHLPRIKKLLVYACTQHWETDAAGLASYHLHELVQQLILIAPTIEALKAHLNGVIQTLNKPGEYTLVANTIIRHLQPLYPTVAPNTTHHYQSLYRVAAEQLAQDEDQARIKKLMYFVCRGQWTKDLSPITLLELVAELHGLTPTYTELTTIFDSVVQNISKPQKYHGIAQRIIKGLAPLYHPATHALITPTPILSSPSYPDATQLQQSSGQAVPNPLDRPIEQIIVSPINGDIQTVKVTPTPALKPSIEEKPAPLSMRKKVTTLTMDDWFSMRIEVHKFTNPLLAKYLLFMNSYAAAVGNDHDSQPGKWDRMTWDALKNTDLDTLLRDGLKSCRNIGEFERSLKRTTRQLNTPNQYKPVISAILRAVYPLFADCTSQEAPVQRITAPPPPEEKTSTEELFDKASLSQTPQHIPHHQKDAADKHTLIEVGQDSLKPNTHTKTASPPALEQTEADSQLDNTDADITEQSQGDPPPHALAESANPIQSDVHSSNQQTEETAFLMQQDMQLEQQRDRALLSAQAHKFIPTNRENQEDTACLSSPTPKNRQTFRQLNVDDASADNPADETVAMPIH